MSISSFAQVFTLLESFVGFIYFSIHDYHERLFLHMDFLHMDLL